MLKIVVFDGGWGGQLVADYIAEELQIAEVVAVTDWQHESYDNLGLNVIINTARKYLQPYIGQADLIVLGGYAATLALENFRTEFPDQKFVGMEIDYRYLNHFRRRKQTLRSALVLAGANFPESDQWKTLKSSLSNTQLILPSCSDWERAINYSHLETSLIRHCLEPFLPAQRPKTYLPALAAVAPKLENTTEKIANEADAAELAAAGLNAGEINVAEPVRAEQAAAELAAAGPAQTAFSAGEPAENTPANMEAETPAGELAGQNYRRVIFYPVRRFRALLAEAMTVRAKALHAGARKTATERRLALPSGAAEVIAAQNDETGARGALPPGQALEPSRPATRNDSPKSQDARLPSRINSRELAKSDADPASQGAVAVMVPEVAAPAYPEVAILLNTHFWGYKEEIQEALGPQTVVIDFRQKLLHDVCLALKLRGVDGRLGE